MPISHPLLCRQPARQGPTLTLLDDCPELRLAQGRVHEACGASRRTLALWLAARCEGPVLWVSPRWGQQNLHCDGVVEWIDPARLVFIHPQRPEDILWTMEEILRSGSVALAVADLPALPGLTQVRRMHLAAETGAGEGRHAPIGLLLTPGAGGAAGVETRWQLSPRHGEGKDGWQLERLRARTAPPQAWEVEKPVQAVTPRLKTA